MRGLTQNTFNINTQIEIRDKYTSQIKPFEKDGPKLKVAANSFFITDNFNPVIGVKEIAIEVGELLKKLLDQKGNMFGIFGQWGRGKTFLWQEITKYLSANEKNSVQFLKVEFHAWKYQDTPASWAYLYEIFADKYFETDYYRSYKFNRTKDKANNAQNFGSKYFSWLNAFTAICKDRINATKRKSG